MKAERQRCFENGKEEWMEMCFENGSGQRDLEMSLHCCLMTKGSRGEVVACHLSPGISFLAFQVSLEYAKYPQNCSPSAWYEVFYHKASHHQRLHLLYLTSLVYLLVPFASFVA